MTGPLGQQTTTKGFLVNPLAGDSAYSQRAQTNLDIHDAYAYEQFAWDRPYSYGLRFAYKGGVVSPGGVVTRIEDGYVTLADDDVNYVERDLDGVVSVNQTGFSSSLSPMAKVTTRDMAIEAVEDWRLPTGTTVDGGFSGTISADQITSGVLSSARGGTDNGEPDLGDLLVGGVGSWLRRAAVVAGSVLLSAGVGTPAIPAWGQIGNAHIAVGAGIELLKLEAPTAGDLMYGNATPVWAPLSIGSAGKMLRSTGTLPAWSTFTQANTYVRGDVLVATAANVLAGKAIGTAGKILRSDGTDPQWTTSTFADTYTQGTVLYASTANTVSGLTVGSSATYLRSNGTIPAWATISATEVTTGNLPYAQLPSGGGTWANGGTLSITGGVTTVAGLTSSALVTASAGLTVTGTLTMTTAGSKLVPGATNFALRNNADSADNLLVADAGGVTFRNTTTLNSIAYTWPSVGANGEVLSIASGGGTSAMTLDWIPAAAGSGTVTDSNGAATYVPVWTSATNIDVKNGAATRLIGGTASFAIRNNADSANNLIITDAGAGTFRTTATALTGLTVGSVSQTFNVDPFPANGLMADISFLSSNTVSITGLRAQVINTAAITTSNMFTIRILAMGKGAGSTITNAYGLYIDGQTEGNTNYAIYTNAGLVRFGDAVSSTSTMTATEFLGATHDSGSATDLVLQRNNSTILTLGAAIITPTVLLTTVASASGGAGLRLPHGSAPSAPVDGDTWTTSAGAFIRINGVTKEIVLV